VLQKVSGSIGPALTPASRGALGYLLTQPVAGHHHAICGQGALLFRSQWARAGAWPVRAAANRRISVCGRCGADQAVHRGGGRDRESCCCCMDATHVELFLHAAWICRTALGRYPPIAVRGSVWRLREIRTPVTEVGDRSSASLPLARMTHLPPTSGVRTAVGRSGLRGGFLSGGLLSRSLLSGSFLRRGLFRGSLLGGSLFRRRLAVAGPRLDAGFQLGQ
jgi:hypothetical protein